MDDAPPRTARPRRIAAGLLVLVAAALGTAGCPRPRPATVPLRTVEIERQPQVPRCLVVLLPGRGDRPEDFERLGFAELLAEHAPAADVVAVDSHLGYFVDRTIVERLHEDVIAPARARGVDQVWLAGISLGGTGSLLYARHHPEDVAGLLLLAPFLGEREVIAEVQAAGGLRGWTPPETLAERDFERRLWSWLERYESPEPELPALYLGYGEGDGFATANRLLAEVLPPERVFTTAGGHTWRAWRRLWASFLASDALAGCTVPAPWP